MTVEPSFVPISIRGRYLWRGDERFFVRGIVYQPRGDWQRGVTNDPISDDRILELEQNVVLFKELGINTIFVYSIDNAKQHDKAMKLLEEAGIYVVTHVSTPSCSIIRSTPYESYNTANVSSFLKTAGLMARYTNTLGIVAANSVVNHRDSLHATPVLKAVVRDLKKYLNFSNRSKGTRVLPVGYSPSSAVHINHSGFLDYLYFGDEENAIDFLALPNYGWAGVKSNMQISGWNALINRYEKFAIPAFLSEYGVNTYQPRQFHETKALYSDPMTRVFSGGCVYEFTDNPNDFGLVATPGTDEERWFQVFGGNQEKVVEVRQTDQGNLYIYHDFANYKAALAEPTDYDPSWDIMERQSAERYNTDPTQMTWPWDPEYQVPATCIDWDNMEELVGH
ncbi:glycolipid anchored surface protein GAS1, partial [Aureobasidium melanogenum]